MKRKVKTSDGFTLVELMAVVVIMGILASLAVVGYRKYIDSAKTNEAREVIGSIKAGQESYFDETMRYLDVMSGAIDTYYPQAAPTGMMKTNWVGTGTYYAGFGRLGVNVTAPVYFGYSTTASATPGTPSAGTGVPGWTPTATNQPYYVVKAVCDINPGGAKTMFVGSSIQSDIYGENVGD